LFKKNKNGKSEKIETVVGKETKMSGKIEAKGSMRVEGIFEGDISAEGDVIVGNNAYVKGHIECNNLNLAGKLEGNAKVEMRLEIFATGVLVGDVVVGSLVVEDGAVFLGESVMKVKGENRIVNENNEEKNEENNGEDIKS